MLHWAILVMDRIYSHNNYYSIMIEPYCDAWCTPSGHKLMPAQHWVILCHNDAWCTALSHADSLMHIIESWMHMQDWTILMLHSIKPYWCLMHNFNWVVDAPASSHIDAGCIPTLMPEAQHWVISGVATIEAVRQLPRRKSGSLY